MTKKLIRYPVFLLFAVCILLLSACGGNQQEQGQAQNQQDQSPIHVRNSTIEHVDRKTGQEISNHLVKLATGVPNVRDATAVVLGKFAIVGIDVEENMERSEVGTVKYAVLEALRHDPYGAEAVVVADPDTFARLNEMGQDIQQGRPVQGILNELSDIVGRVIPDVPNEMHSNDPEQAPEEQKNNVNNKEQKSLEKEQEDQSYHHK